MLEQFLCEHAFEGQAEILQADLEVPRKLWLEGNWRIFTENGRDWVDDVDKASSNISFCCSFTFSKKNYYTHFITNSNDYSFVPSQWLFI